MDRMKRKNGLYFILGWLGGSFAGDPWLAVKIDGSRPMVGRDRHYGW